MPYGMSGGSSTEAEWGRKGEKGSKRKSDANYLARMGEEERRKPKTMAKVLCVKCGGTIDGCGVCGEAMSASRTERGGISIFRQQSQLLFSALLFSIGK